MEEAPECLCVSVVIPTLNAETMIGPLLESLKEQNLPPREILVVDSASEDRTCEIARSLGARVIQIRREDFDHGGTRDMGLRLCEGEIVLFLTQDALPCSSHYIEYLTAPFQDPRVGAVGGRQIARAQARPYEKRVREFNYPAEDRKWDRSAVPKLGVRAFLISDVCAAYRKEAYLKAGGFDAPILTNEDMLMAQKLLECGYALAYSAGAAVWHSHNYSLREEYRRNHLIGRFMKRYEKRLSCGSETGEGLRLVRYVLGKLMSEGQILEAAAFCMNCAARLSGNRMGRMAEGRRMKAHEG